MKKTTSLILVSVLMSGCRKPDSLFSEIKELQAQSQTLGCLKGAHYILDNKPPNDLDPVAWKLVVQFCKTKARELPQDEK